MKIDYITFTYFLVVSSLFSIILFKAIQILISVWN